MKKQFDLEKIIEMIKSGMREQEIIKRLNLNCSSASFSQFIYSSTEEHFNDIRKQGFKDELNNVLRGNKYLFQVRKQFNYSPFGFFSAVEKIDYLDIFRKEKTISGFMVIELLDSLTHDGIPQIDDAIRKGLGTGEISREIGHEEGYVQRYLKGSGQYTFWNKRKSERKLRLNGIKLDNPRAMERYL